MQIIKSTLLSMLRHAVNMTVAAPFWLMAFAAFLMRLFVVPPFGALLALAMGVVWCCGNAESVRTFIGSVRQRIFNR